MAESETVEPNGELHTADFDGEIRVRDASLREIEMRIVPWNVIRSGKAGPEVFERGAFDGIDPKHVVLRLEHQDPPGGRGAELEARADGQWGVFKVSETSKGDEILTLARDGVTRGVSPGYYDVPGGTAIETRNGRRTRVVRKALLAEASTTWRPTWEQSAVLSVRSKEGDGPMAESQEAAAPAAEPAVPVIPTVDTSGIQRAFDGFADKMTERLEKLEERNRSEIVVPSAEPQKPAAHKGEWFQVALKLLSGENISQRMLQERALADLVTPDNAGVVPEAFSAEMIGIIDAGRPFLNSTRRIPTPTAGMTLNMPVLTTRPTAGVQTNEKDDITSTTTSITSSGFDAVTIAGGGDISLQLLKRSEPSYLDLYLQLLAEAISENAEAEAIAALLGAGVSAGTGAINPAALTIGEAWTNAQTVRQRADTIWFSSDAIAAFIDAKASSSNLPLYSNLAADITVGGTAGGRISGLTPVYVPALDGSGVDVMVGPSRGFAWAEDGAFTLQVDNPGAAGRDVALVVIDWFAPLYPAAFTTYAL